MNKFKELQFLKQLNGIGNSKINKNYLNLISQSSNFDDFIDKVKSLNEFDDIWKKNSVDDFANIIGIVEKLYNEMCEDSDITVLTVFDERYPKKLEVMKDKKPVVLYTKGNIDILDSDNIAVIGTREPSEWSKKAEEKIVKTIISCSKRVIVSGLALGCDYIAHVTTVNNYKPTVAVLPSGINKITPSSHQKLSEDIVKNGGCLITEYLPNEMATPFTYVARDSIIAAISDSTFVVECDLKSGTMHTVDAAVKYKKTIASFIANRNGNYEGNNYIINKLHGIKVSNQEELEAYLSTLESNNKQNSLLEYL